MINKLWVFGDSFCADGVGRWVEHLKTDTPYLKCVNHAVSGSDMRTILESWLQHIPMMSENDGIVVCVGEASRVRYPKKKKEVSHTSWTAFSSEYWLHFPVNVNFSEMYSKAPEHFEVWDFPVLDLDEMQKFHDYSMLMSDSWANTTAALNMIEPLYTLTPCSKKFVYTWHSYPEKYYLYNQDWMKRNIFQDEWDTSHQEYKRTAGARGKKYDNHLSSTAEKQMFNYVKSFFQLI